MARLRLLVLAGLVVSLAFFSSLRAADEKKDEKNPAARPVGRLDNKGWMKRHEDFVARSKKGHVDVVFLGDSITQGWEGAGREAWKKTFEPLHAGNYGIGGDQTGHVLWRITEGKELEGINPKVAVIMIGTNNTGRDSAEQIAEGITAIVKELKKQKPHIKILLLGVFPRAGKPIAKDATQADADQLSPKIKQINDIISKLDDGKSVFYKDIGNKFLDEKGNLPRAIMPDYLHLSPRGYEIWADAIKDDVEKLLK